MTPRYIVNGVTGYSIGQREASSKQATSYSVLDTCYLYREVAQFYARPGLRNEKQRERAEALCDELNARNDAA